MSQFELETEIEGKIFEIKFSAKRVSEYSSYRDISGLDSWVEIEDIKINNQDKERVNEDVLYDVCFNHFLSTEI